MSLKNITIGFVIGLMIVGIVAFIMLPETHEARDAVRVIPFLIKKAALRCVPEGGIALQCGGQKNEKCCTGLQSINNNKMLNSYGTCSEVYGLCGSILCSAECGNGVCEGKENKCNCQVDCK